MAEATILLFSHALAVFGGLVLGLALGIVLCRRAMARERRRDVEQMLGRL